jgi:hypothetical protein
MVRVGGRSQRPALYAVGVILDVSISEISQSKFLLGRNPRALAGRTYAG